MSRIHDALKRAELRETTSDAETMPSVEPRAAGASVLSLDETRTDPSLVEMEQALIACPPTAWKPDLNTMLFFAPQEGRPGMEQFRTLRSRLGLARNDRPTLKKVLISSPLPQEGKSTVAANLAQVIVYQAGPRVLLIDADLRTPCLHQELGAPSAPGLAEYMKGDCEALSVIQRGPLQNLYFIPAGVAISNPAEQIANGRMKTLLDRLEPLFDWIIIDSSPAAVVSDASVLATHCDGVLLVVRSGVTPIERAKQACNEFHESKLLGVVLNAASNGQGPYGQEYGQSIRAL
jgi:protein-tyrosine kinase